MKTQRIVAAVAAASLAFSSVAFAQSEGAREQAMRANGEQNPNGPLQTPQQLRDGAREAQQQYRESNRGQVDQRGQYRGQPVPHDQYRGQPDPRGQYRSDGRDHRGANQGYEYRNYGYHDGGYRGQGRGVGPNHSWYRGDRMPYEYRTRHYVVDDWRGHHLYAPPRGYQWVQSGGDYLLVAVATGIIASILLNQ